MKTIASLHSVIAATPDEQRRGLSGWPSMGDFDAMAFPFQPARPVTMGFEQMLFDLDVVMVGVEGTIIEIYADVPAGSKASITCKKLVAIVLEMAAGQAAARGMAIGQQLLVKRDFTYDPSEARDDHGRWTADGGSGADAAPGLAKVGIDGLAVERGRGRIYVAKVNGKDIGHATLAEDHPFITSSAVDAGYQRRGLASAIYDVIEKDIGRRLVPSPLGLTPSATSFWRDRLGKLPGAEANALVDEAMAIGRGYGISDEHLAARLDPLRRHEFFDPNEPRVPAGESEGGEWTGGAVGAVSPSTAEGMNFKEAVSSLGGDRHARMRQAFDEVDKAMDIPAHMQDAVGAWADGAENSMLVDFAKNTPWDAVQANMALKGYYADQKAVLAFQPDPAGSEAMYRVSVPSSDMAALHDDLLSRGVEFHTLVPTHSGTDVYVYDQAGTLGDKVNTFGSDHNGTTGYLTGKGEFIGDWNDRAVARTAYVRTIEAFAGSGHATPQFRAWWTANRDRRYEAALGEVFIAWFFNPSHVAAGSPEGGQFAPKDSGAVPPESRDSGEGRLNDFLDLPAKLWPDHGKAFAASLADDISIEKMRPEQFVQPGDRAGMLMPNGEAYVWSPFANNHAPVADAHGSNLREVYANGVARIFKNDTSFGLQWGQDAVPTPAQIRFGLALPKYGDFQEGYIESTQIPGFGRAGNLKIISPGSGGVASGVRAIDVNGALKEVFGDKITIHDIDDEGREYYSPDQPRVPSGSGRESGEWSSGAGQGTSTIKSVTDYSEPGLKAAAERILFKGRTAEDIAKAMISETNGVEFKVSVKAEDAGGFPRMTIQWTGLAVEEENPILIRRVFELDNNDKLVVNHADFEVPPSLEGKGLAKALYRGSIPEYQRLGVDRIETTANLEIGGYAWARFGFLPVKDDAEYLAGHVGVEGTLGGVLESIPHDVVSRLQADIMADPAHGWWTLADARYTPKGYKSSINIGRAVMRGMEWKGQLSLHNPEQMKRLRTYVGA